MKLLNCTSCNDVIALQVGERVCLCGRSRARYIQDGLRVVYSGRYARIMGMRNPEYDRAVEGQDYVWFLIPEGRNIKREKDHNVYGPK
jgi:hypothetical protein